MAPLIGILLRWGTMFGEFPGQGARRNPPKWLPSSIGVRLRRGVMSPWGAISGISHWGSKRNPAKLAPRLHWIPIKEGSHVAPVMGILIRLGRHFRCFFPRGLESCRPPYGGGWLAAAGGGRNWREDAVRRDGGRRRRVWCAARSGWAESQKYTNQTNKTSKPKLHKLNQKEKQRILEIRIQNSGFRRQRPQDSEFTIQSSTIRNSEF